MRSVIAWITAHSPAHSTLDGTSESGTGTTGAPPSPGHPAGVAHVPVSYTHLDVYKRQEFKKFLIRIDQEVPADLEVHLILDNYATHKTPDIHRWLLRHPRFHLHFTPTSGSWLNMVERWFGELTTKKIKRGAHTNVPNLEKDIREWIAQWNENPRPYVWVKTADQILESLARYCERISAAAAPR